MSELQTQHEAHKARVARLGGVPWQVTRRRVVVAPVVEPKPVVIPEPRPLPVERRDPIILKGACIIGRKGTQPERAPYRGIPASRIKLAVAKIYGFTPSDLDSQVRCQPLVSVRHMAVYLVHRYTLRTPGWIGWFFGGRDHTTTLNSMRKVAALRCIDPELDAELGYLESVICK